MPPEVVMDDGRRFPYRGDSYTITGGHNQILVVEESALTALAKINGQLGVKEILPDGNGSINSSTKREDPKSLLDPDISTLVKTSEQVMDKS